MFRTPALGALALLTFVPAFGCGKKDADPAPGGGPTGPSDGAPVVRARDADDKRLAANRLKRIGIALHNTHDVYGYLPAGVMGPKGQLGLSWRVAILPFIEQDHLYKQFKLDEPWDSDHNKKLLPLMPKTYESPGVIVSTGKTFLRAFAGPSAFIPGPFPLPKGAKGPPPSPWANQPPSSIARGRTIPSITDGTSNTYMVVEAAEAVEWTKPDELSYPDAPGADPGKPRAPLPKLGPFSEGGFHALFCDGSVRFIRDGISEDTLRALITVNGGEVFTLDDDNRRPWSRNQDRFRELPAPERPKEAKW